MRDMLLVLFGSVLAVFLQLVFGDVLNWLLRPEKASRILLLPLKEDIPDLERWLRWALFCLDDSRCGAKMRLYAVDMGLSQENRYLAQRLLSGRSDCIICDSEKLRGLMADDKVYKELEFVLY